MNIKRLYKKISFFSILSFVLLSCKNHDNEIEKFKILMPTGAPTLAFYDSIINNKQSVTTTSQITQIPIELQRKNSEYDFIVFDSIKALNLINNKKSDYKFIKMLTGGNFHLVGYNKSFNDIPSKDDYIVSFAKDGITDKVCQYLFSDFYQNNVKYVNSVNECVPILKTGKHSNNDVDWVLMAEPALTNVMNENNNDDKKDNNILDKYDLTQLIKEETNNKFDYIPQAALFIKNEIYKNYREEVANYLKEVLIQMDDAINNLDKIIAEMSKFDINKQKQIFGFDANILKHVQQTNRFGICDPNNDINEQNIKDFISLIS